MGLSAAVRLGGRRAGTHLLRVDVDLVEAEGRERVRELLKDGGDDLAAGGDTRELGPAERGTSAGRTRVRTTSPADQHSRSASTTRTLSILVAHPEVDHDDLAGEERQSAHASTTSQPGPAHLVAADELVELSKALDLCDHCVKLGWKECVGGRENRALATFSKMSSYKSTAYCGEGRGRRFLLAFTTDS